MYKNVILQRARVWAWATALGLAAALVGCGSSTVESQLNPSRFFVMGDGFSDADASARYTVNDGTINNWALQLANGYSKTLANGGVIAFAKGNARVIGKPDAAGVNTTATLKEQIDSFAAAYTVGSSDVFLIGVGTADVIKQVSDYKAASQTSAQALSNVIQASRDYATQVKRLLDLGAKYVLIIGPYNLGRSPWATRISETTLLTTLSQQFFETLAVELVAEGNRVLYIDVQGFFNNLVASPSVNGFTNATQAVCTSVDAGAGIGVGSNQVNSNLCTASTLVSGADHNKYIFADEVYPTPAAHRLFGDSARLRLRERW